jgi:DNA polymerase-4
MQTYGEQGSPVRKIIHVDMDAFYAAVEIRDNPSLRGKPVIVGGSPESRGVVSTCSYEARKYGIHSAMASANAIRRCPQAIFIRPNFNKYKEASKQIREIFFEYTDLVEPLSLDEAYLDVTVNKKNMPFATGIAREILHKILKKTGLTASAGVSFNKFLAKVASDYKKPNGLTVVTPKNADKFINSLLIRKFFGVGKVTEQKMLKLGIRTGFDLKQKSRKFLHDHFGKSGNYFYDIAHGLDNRPVNPHRERKSIGKERTFAVDMNNRTEMLEFLTGLSKEVSEYMSKHQKRGRTITLKVKFFNFDQITRSVSLTTPTNSATTIMQHIEQLLLETEAGQKKVRLLGITLSNLI